MRRKGFSDEMIKDEVAYGPRKIRDQITFADRSNKKSSCARLTNFLGLCDFIVINLLYCITKNTFIELSLAFKRHSSFGPTLETIENVRDINRQLEDVRDEGNPQSPLFIATLILQMDLIEISPSQSISMKLIDEIICLIMDAIQEVKSFQSDTKYLIFSQPTILGHQEDKLYERPPRVVFLFEVDETFEVEKNCILEYMAIAYQKMDTYIKRFEQIRESYREDMLTDKEALRTESNLDKLISYCKRYTSEINGLDDLLPSCNLGLFQLNQDTFKEKIIPKCKELLSILEQLLPR
jgi:dynein heavy chain